MASKSPDPRAKAELSTCFRELSVDHLPPAERLPFWNEAAGKRMECFYAAPDGRPVRAHLQALVAPGIDFMEYESDGFIMRRSRRLCRGDDRDEISIGLVVSPRSGAVQDGAELPLRRGDLYVVDFGRPLDSVTLSHHGLALALPRKLVAQAMGSATDRLGGRILSTRGIGGLLASHMSALAREVRFLSPTQQRIALQAASDLALATLQGNTPDTALDMERFSGGFYAAACRTIEAHCVDPTFNAEKLAALLGRSRASLYRVFSGREPSVAGTIWAARLRYVQRMLQAPRYRNLSISEIASRCGFLDLPAFSRMYKLQYGVSPRDTRHNASV